MILGGSFLSGMAQGQIEGPKSPKPVERSGAAAATHVVDPNPALLYWQAWALLPELRAGQFKVISGVLDGSVRGDDESVRTLLATVGKGLDRFARAARGTQPCVWGTTFDEGPFAPIPHLTKVQLMCRLALVKAEAHYAAEELEEAWKWTRHAHAAARHLSAEPLLITVIAQHAVEQQALRLTARHVLGMEVEWATQVAESMRSLAPLHEVREALTRENAVADWMRLMVLNLQGRLGDEKTHVEEIEAYLRAQMEGGDKARTEDARRSLEAVADWKKLATQAKDLQQKTVAASALPWVGYRAAMEEVRASLQGANPALSGSLPAFEGAMYKQFETATLRTMLLAVLQPPEDGHEDGEMPGFKDAFEGKPLLLKKEAEAWTITSASAGASGGKVVMLRLSR